MEPNRVPRNVLEPSKVWHGHEGEFDSHTRGPKRSSDQCSTVRSLSDVQRELNFASGGNGIFRLYEAAIQADAANYTNDARSRAEHHPCRYLAGQTTEISSFHLATVHRNLRLQGWLILQQVWAIGHQGRFAVLNIHWLGTGIKAFITVDTVERTQPEKS